MIPEEMIGHAFDAGVQHAVDAIMQLLDGLAECVPSEPACTVCETYWTAAAEVAKWAAHELDGAS